MQCNPVHAPSVDALAVALQARRVRLQPVQPRAEHRKEPQEAIAQRHVLLLQVLGGGLEGGGGDL